MTKKANTVGELYLGNENLKDAMTVPRFKRITKNGSLTIPAHIRKSLGINAKDKYEIIVDEKTGDITLKRIAGVDALAPITENLFNYNGRKISIQTAIEIHQIVEEMMRVIEIEVGEPVEVDDLAGIFDQIWNDEEDDFLTNPILRESALLRSLETRDNEIREAIKEDTKAKAKKSKKEKIDNEKAIVDRTINRILSSPILMRVTNEEAETYFKKTEYRKLLKEMEKENK